MIEKKTVLILGAGASCPYGYPTGRELRQQICSQFVDDITAYFTAQGEHERRIFTHTHKYQAKGLAEIFRKSSTKSIDLFLARNPEFKLMGKWAIIFRILAAEKTSLFRESMRNSGQDWYSYLLQRLTDDLVNKEDYKQLGNNNISFVTFNYDRSLEHFLYESLLNSFSGIDEMKIVKQLDKIKIIHVFGQIAGLDWQEMPSRIEYRRETRYIDIKGLFDNMKIIYEESDNPALKEAHKSISEAERIFLLGFGYARENLETLKVPQILNKKQQIYGTALNFTKREIESVKSIFPQSSPPYAPTVYIEDLDCLMLLREFL